MGARMTALQPDENPPSSLLQLAWLVDRWGALPVLGLEPDIFLLSQLSRVLNVYTTFKKSKQPGMLGRMSGDEQRLMAHVMGLFVEDG